MSRRPEDVQPMMEDSNRGRSRKRMAQRPARYRSTDSPQQQLSQHQPNHLIGIGQQASGEGTQSILPVSLQEGDLILIGVAYLFAVSLQEGDLILIGVADLFAVGLQEGDLILIGLADLFAVDPQEGDLILIVVVDATAATEVVGVIAAAEVIDVIQQDHPDPAAVVVVVTDGQLQNVMVTVITIAIVEDHRHTQVTTVIVEDLVLVTEAVGVIAVAEVIDVIQQDHPDPIIAEVIDVIQQDHQDLIQLALRRNTFIPF